MSVPTRARSALALTLIVLTEFAGTESAPATHAAPTRQSDVLHLRDLVIADDQGRPRLLLGTPSPNFDGCKRQTGVDGIVPLGPDGADQVMISYWENGASQLARAAGAKAPAVSWDKKI